MIQREIDISKELTIFTVSGSVTARELGKTIRSFYAANVTLYALWDFRDGNVELTEDEVWNLALSVRTLNLSTRTGGKTAFVTQKGAPLGLAKMYQLITDTMSLPFEIQVFTSIEEAHHWLGVGDAPTS